MNAPGKSLLRISSVLLAVFGAIVFLFASFIIIVSAGLTSSSGFAGELKDRFNALGTLGMIVAIFLLVISAAEFVLGVMGVRKIADPAKANYFIKSGMLLCALGLICAVGEVFAISVPVLGVICFLLSLLYILGGMKNKKAAVAPAA